MTLIIKNRIGRITIIAITPPDVPVLVPDSFSVSGPCLKLNLYLKEAPFALDGGRKTIKALSFFP
jgi:hypothetical protein